MFILTSRQIILFCIPFSFRASPEIFHSSTDSFQNKTVLWFIMVVHKYMSLMKDQLIFWRMLHFKYKLVKCKIWRNKVEYFNPKEITMNKSRLFRIFPNDLNNLRLKRLFDSISQKKMSCQRRDCYRKVSYFHNTHIRAH